MTAKKSKAFKLLKEVAKEYKRQENPDLPERYISSKPYSEKNANELTKSVIAFIEYMGFQAERISVTGRKVASAKKVRDTFTGEIRTVGRDKYIKSSMRKGSADAAATIRGHAVKIEIKIGKDSQSDHQKEYQADTERAGGTYLIAKNFDHFFNWFVDYMGIEGDFMEWYKKYLQENKDWIFKDKSKIDWTK